LASGDWTAVLGAAFVGSLWFNLFDLLAWEMKAGVFIWLFWPLLCALVRHGPSFQTSGWVRFWPSGSLCCCLARPAKLAASPLDQARFAQTGALTISPTAFTNDARRLGLAYFLQQEETETAVVTWQADGQSVPFLAAAGHGGLSGRGVGNGRWLVSSGTANR
jgi:hypothetical protein